MTAIITTVVNMQLERFVMHIAPPVNCMSKLVTDLPLHVILISLVRKHAETNIRIEIMETDGEVRATSLVCLLGVGIGVGSYLLYRLWHRVFQVSTPRSKLVKKSRPSTPCSLIEDGQLVTCHSQEKVFPDSPDSGCQTMGNNDSSQSSATITPDSPLHHRSEFASTSANQIYYQRSMGTVIPKAPEDLETVNQFSEHVHGSFVVINSKDNDDLSSFSIETSPIVNGLRKMSDSAISSDCKEAALYNQGTSKRNSIKHNECGQLNTREHFAILSESMEGSVISSTSTDQGFISGSYSADATRDSSEEPKYIIGSNRYTDKLDIKDNQHQQGKRSCKLQKYDAVQDLVSFSIGDTEINPHMNDNSISFSCLEDAGVALSMPQEGSASVYTPQEKALPCSNEPALTSFSSETVKHSTPQNNEGQDLTFKEIPFAPFKRYPGKIRRNYSFTSEASNKSDASYYLFGGHSVHGGEIMSGRSTPDSDTLRSLDFHIGFKTEANINEIHDQILGLRDDLENMSQKVQILTSRDNLAYVPEIDSVNDVIRGSRLHKSTRAYRRHTSLSIGEESVHSLFSDDQERDAPKMSTSQGDFIWDYQSDLASGVHENFVAHRPLMGKMVDIEDTASEMTVPYHMHAYLQQQSESINIPNDSKHFGHTSDMYIDDGFSFQQPYTPPKFKGSIEVLSPLLEKETYMKTETLVNKSLNNDKISGENLCEDCKHSCCSNCGKHINSNNNNSNKSESDTKSNATQTENVLHLGDSFIVNASTSSCPHIKENGTGKRLTTHFNDEGTPSACCLSQGNQRQTVTNYSTGNIHPVSSRPFGHNHNSHQWDPQGVNCVHRHQCYDICHKANCHLLPAQHFLGHMDTCRNHTLVNSIYDKDVSPICNADPHCHFHSQGSCCKMYYVSDTNICHTCSSKIKCTCLSPDN